MEKLDQFTALRLIQRAVTDYKNSHQAWEVNKVQEMGFEWDRRIYTSTIQEPELQQLLNNIHTWISQAFTDTNPA